MPHKYKLKAPDGRTFQVTAPDGATKEQVLAYARAHYAKAPTITPGSEQAAAMTHGRTAPPQDAIEPSHPIDKITAMVRGNAAEDLPSVGSAAFDEATGRSFLDAFPTAVASAFGNDEDYTNAVLKSVPGAKLAQDANGNRLIVLEGGQRFYVNQPGLDMGDVERGLDKAGGFALALSPAGRVEGAVGRMVAGSLASGGADAAMQVGASVAGGNPKLDLTQTAVAAGLGGASELAPAVGGAMFRGAKKALTTDAKAAARGAQVARQANIPTEGLSQVDLIRMGRRFPEVQGGASPDAALAESEFGFNLTRGQKTGDVSQLRREEMLRSSGTGNTAGRAAHQVDDAQRQNLEDQAQRVQDYLARKPSGTPEEATEGAIGGVQRQSQGLKGRIDEAYNDVRAQRAAVDVQSVKTIPDALRRAVSDFDVSTELTPATLHTIESVSNSIARLPANAKGVSMKAIEGTRKKILGNIGAAKNATDKAAMIKLKNAFDGWIDDAFDKAMITGDREALDKLKQARALRHEYAQRFEPTKKGDQAGKLVQRMIDAEATPDELAGALFGSSQVAPRAAVSMVRKLRKALGPETEAWNAVRAATVRKAITNRAGEVAGPQAITSNLARLFKERPALMNTMYSAPERALLQRFAKAVSVLIPPGTLAKSSGTGERLFAYFAELLNGIPFGGTAMNVLSAPRRAATASKMMAPVTKDVPRWIPQTLGSGVNTGHENRLLRMYQGAENAPGNP